MTKGQLHWVHRNAGSTISISGKVTFFFDTHTHVSPTLTLMFKVNNVHERNVLWGAASTGLITFQKNKWRKRSRCSAPLWWPGQHAGRGSTQQTTNFPWLSFTLRLRRSRSQRCQVLREKQANSQVYVEKTSPKEATRPRTHTRAGWLIEINRNRTFF